MPDIRRAIEATPSEVPAIRFSKDGKNVVVFMIDRAISSYVPYMFQEKPELAEQFSGFTWYPNTLSYGMRTVVAAPALFGGYDYTPVGLNRRSDVPLVTKHDESLLTMPVLFSREGYDVTVIDPPCAGYSEIGVYDNTRIIIVSDHGWPTGQFEDLLLFDGLNPDTIYNSEDIMAYNPVLFFKDFDSDAPFRADDTFMTNADTPYLAMYGLLDNPLNPFTSNPMYQPEAKEADRQFVMYTDRWALAGNNESTFKDCIWYSVRNRYVLDRDNWAEETVDPVG